MFRLIPDRSRLPPPPKMLRSLAIPRDPHPTIRRLPRVRQTFDLTKTETRRAAAQMLPLHKRLKSRRIPAPDVHNVRALRISGVAPGVAPARRRGSGRS
jgi:hypothetical protein